MARLQVPQNIINASASTVATALSGTSIKVTSFIIQSLKTNTDFVKIGNRANQYFEIAPGRDLEVHGDNLDNGTSAYIDLSEWFIVAVSGTQSINVLYLERY